MTPEELLEVIALPGWGLSKLAQVLNVRLIAVQQAASGKRPISPELERWLEEVAAVWTPLPADLREIARQMQCDQGKFVRRPRGTRAITDDEAELLENVTWFHAHRPGPQGWRGAS